MAELGRKLLEGFHEAVWQLWPIFKTGNHVSERVGGGRERERGRVEDLTVHVRRLEIGECDRQAIRGEAGTNCAAASCCDGKEKRARRKARR